MDGTTPVTETTQTTLPVTPTPDAPPVAPAAAPAASPAAIEQDVDDLALTQLRREQETADADPAATGTGTPAQPGDGAAADAAAALPGASGDAAAAAAGNGAPAPAAQPVDPTITIPKARLDQVLQQRDKHSQEAAYWRGVAEGRQQPAAASAAPAAPAAPAKTPKEMLDELDAKKVDLAGQFDDGKISAKQWKEQEAALDREARDLLTQSLRPAAAAPASQPADGELYLDNLTAQLEDAHPYSLVIPPDDKVKWSFIEAEARTQLLGEGVVLRGDGRSLYQLRERMASLTDQYGPLWTGLTAEQAQAQAARITGKQPPSRAVQTPAAPGQPGGLSRTGQDRAAKLALAARHPPSPAAAGAAGGSGLADVTDAQVSGMSDEDITALPESVRRRFSPTG